MELLLRIITAVATLAIGVAAWLLAYQQFRISKAKLRFDLYGKRLDLFNRLRSYTVEVGLEDNSEGLQTLQDASNFYRETIECRFLFDNDVSSYFMVVFGKAQKLAGKQIDLSSPNLADNEREELAREIVELKIWFIEQAEEMFGVFGRDLSIKTLR